MFDDLSIKIPGGFSGLFKKKKTKCVGIDIGNSSIKIVELEKKGDRIVLKNYAISNVNRKGLIKPGSSKVINSSVGEIVDKVLDDIGIKTKDVNVAIPGFASLITIIELPPVSEKEIEQIIQVEAPKYIPVPLEEVIYGWEVINEKKPGAGEGADPKLSRTSRRSAVKVVLVSIMKSISQEYEKVFTKSGYDINSLEVDMFALKRSIVGPNLNSNCLIVDVGGNITNISAIVNGSVVVNRSIDVGGDRVTDLLSKMLNVDRDRAEKIKVNQGLEIDSQEVKNQILMPLLKNISEEIQKTLKIFDENYPDLKIESIVLTGGFSQMNGFSDFLEKETNIKTTRANPWSKLDYPKEIEKSLSSLSPYFGIAVGLALRGLIEE